jgi:hypothetical protein
MVTATPTMERQRDAHSRILRLEGIELIASAGSSAELLVQELEFCCFFACYRSLTQLKTFTLYGLNEKPGEFVPVENVLNFTSLSQI